MPKVIKKLAEEFRAVIPSLQAAKSPLIIVITQVDPDAIGSALGLQTMLTDAGIQTSIVYCGRFGHPQNRALINQLSLSSVLIPADKFTPPAGSRFALVDSSAINEARLPEAMKPLDPVIIIDHHRHAGNLERAGRFVLIDETVGSASTLVTELLFAMNAQGPESLPLPQFEAAAALALGIFTDTRSLTGASKRDREAYGLLTEYIDQDLLRKLMKYDFPPSYFEHLREALITQRRFESRIVASAGFLGHEEGDYLSTIADYLSRQIGITLVAVWGIVEQSVRISVRSSDPTVNLDKYLKEMFGNDNAGAKFTPDGRSEGGVLIKVPLEGFWFNPDDQSNREHWLKITGQQIAHRFGIY